MRLFVALEVPDDVRTPLDAALAGLRERRDDLRWTPPSQWHLTLAFIGHVDAEVDEVAAALEPAAASTPGRIRLALAGPGRFGDRVLWIGVSDEPEGAVAELGTRTQEAIAAAGLPVDDKPVRPHITLARGRRRGRARVRAGLVDAIPSLSGTWTVGEMALIESVQQGRGQPNRHEARARLPFSS